ncbi:MAG TPA: carboxypeptidase regulatory-like domain-containing protein [Myxococcota bacterium]|nr:carboxypeptidase regulatory-like domain-containing protein [Myxococcota bacterium]
MRLAAALGCLLWLGAAQGAGAEASLSGRVSLALGRLALADVAPLVVYLEPLDGQRADPPREPATLRQHGARFEPSFLVVSAGQGVRMPNDDTIFHNVFSYSKPNDFDLGLYRSGESKLLRFEHAGPVRLYCSIHDQMNGLIFVAPTPLFAVVGSSGGFRIASVPPGRHRVRVWSERLPELVREIALAPGDDVVLALVLGETR